MPFWSGMQSKGKRFAGLIKPTPQNCYYWPKNILGEARNGPGAKPLSRCPPCAAPGMDAPTKKGSLKRIVSVIAPTAKSCGLACCIQPIDPLT